MIQAVIASAVRSASFHRDTGFEIWAAGEWVCLGRPATPSDAKLYCTVKWDRGNEILVKYEDGSPDTRLYV